MHLSGNKIAEELGITRKTLYNKLHKLGITTIKTSHINENIFDTIDTEEKAYWLGFLFADGYVSSRSYTIELALSSVDKDHIEKFKKFLQDDRDGSVIKVSKVSEKYERARYLVGSFHLHQTLCNLGCIPNKSLTLVFPSIEIFKQQDLIFDFIRGYVDGDGCLYNQHGRLCLEILGTENFLMGIKKYFPTFNGPIKDKRSNVYRIYCSFSTADTICDKLYSHKMIYLDRKFEKFATYFKSSEKSGNIGEDCDVNTETTDGISQGSSAL